MSFEVKDRMSYRREKTGFYGVDISSYQTIDDPLLFFKRIDFVYFRAYGSDHSGTGDSSFENFVSLASQHGVKSGAYYFGTPTKSDNWKDDAEAQAQQFIKKLKSGYRDGYGQLIPMLDVEVYTDRTTKTAGYPMASNMTGEELVEWILAFQDYFYQNTKRALGIYSSRFFLIDLMKMTDDQLRRLSFMPLWLAEYDRWHPENETNPPLKLGGWNNFTLWQYEVTTEADTYGVTSANNEIDQNYSYDLEAIMPPPVPTNVTVEQTSNKTILISFTEPVTENYIRTDIYLNEEFIISVPKGKNQHEMVVSMPIGHQLQVNVVALNNWNDTAWSENIYLTIE